MTNGEQSSDSEDDLLQHMNHLRKGGKKTVAAKSGRSKVTQLQDLDGAEDDTESGNIIVVRNTRNTRSTSVTSTKAKKASKSDDKVKATRKKAKDVEGDDAVAAPKPVKAEKRSEKKRRAIAHKYDVFPSSLVARQPVNFTRITRYLKKSPEGVPGLQLCNVDGRPIVASIDPELFPSSAGGEDTNVRVGDMILSANRLDSRFASYDKIAAELQFRNTMSEVSGDARASIRNSVTDALVVVVFARTA